MDWFHIRHWGDIDYLKQQYGGFYDTCLTEVNFKSGSYVDENDTMYYGTEKDRQVSMLFQRQWAPKNVELLFSGVKRCNIAAWTEHSEEELQGCFFELRGDILPNQNLILWSDRNPFECMHGCEDGFLAEPAATYVIASKLQWRFT